MNKQNNYILHITNVDIPHNVNNFLSLGHNFNMNDFKKSNDIKNIIIDLEYALKVSNPQPDIYRLRNKINNIITNYINSSKQNSQLNPLEKQIIKDAKDTRIFLKNNPDFIITKADKCNTTVIMTKQQYKDKMDEHLNNRQTYIKILND